MKMDCLKKHFEKYTKDSKEQDRHKKPWSNIFIYLH